MKFFSYLFLFFLLGACVHTESQSPKALYHMIEKNSWDKHKSENSEYFPDAYEKEGFIHLSPTLERLLKVANKYYRDEQKDFVIIELDPSSFQKPREVIYEAGVAVKKVKEPSQKKKSEQLWPHLYGGGILPSDVIKEIFIKQNASGDFFLP